MGGGGATACRRVLADTGLAKDVGDSALRRLCRADVGVMSDVRGVTRIGEVLRCMGRGVPGIGEVPSCRSAGEAAEDT